MNTPDECCDGADSSGYMKVLIQIAISRVGGRPDPDSRLCGLADRSERNLRRPGGFLRTGPDSCLSMRQRMEAMPSWTGGRARICCPVVSDTHPGRSLLNSAACPATSSRVSVNPMTWRSSAMSGSTMYGRATGTWKAVFPGGSPGPSERVLQMYGA